MSSLPQLPGLPQPQGDTSGMTQVGPTFQPPQRQQQVRASGLPGLAMSIYQQVTARKHKETEQTINYFVQNAKGMQETQGLLQNAQEQNKQAIQAFQSASTPEEKQAAQQRILQSVQQVRQLQSQLQQNQANLKDMFNGPKQDKHAKIISKAFGIDDKNANTSERQAAIKAIQQSTGTDPKTASLMSRMPARMQLSPQAERQSMLRQAGVTGAPATGGQVLNAQMQQQKLGQQKDLAVQRRQASLMQAMPKLEASGYTFVKDEKGNPVFDENGFPTLKGMTAEEISKNPELASKQDMMRSVIGYNKAKADLATNPDNPVNQIRALNAEANMKRANAVAVAVSQGSIEAQAKMLASGDLAPSQISARVRGPVLDAAKKINPNLNPESAEADFKGEIKTYSEFTGGKAAENSRRLNTALGHLDDLSVATKALDNGDYRALNTIAQRWGIETGGSPAVVFDAVRAAVAGELGSTFKGAAATDPEIAAIGATINKDLSGKVTEDVIKADMKLLSHRLGASQHQFDVGTRGKHPDFKILSGQSEQILQKHGVGDGTVPDDDELLKQLNALP